MHPWLINWTINGFTLKVPMYGVLLATAFLSGYAMSMKNAVRVRENPQHIENIFLLMIVLAVLGSRLFHVFFEEWPYYSQHPAKIFMIWEGGYTFYGALICCIAGIWGYCKYHNLSFLKFTDICAPATVFGLFLGRLGCFFAGCCWGKICELPWCVRFSNPEAFTDDHIHYLHPSQLYESFGALMIFFYLRWRFKNRKYDGQAFFEGVILYAVLRFVVEYFRGDEYRGYMFNGLISYSQFVSIAMIVPAIVGIVVYGKRKKKRK